MTLKMSFSAVSLLNQRVDFDQTCTETAFGLPKKSDLDFGDLDLIFKASGILIKQFVPNDGRSPNYVLYHWGN